MKKRKTYEISVIDKTYSKIISDETKFYTSDTALELTFELKETEYNFESAEIVLLNVDDRSLATRPVYKVNNNFVYEIDDDITSHYGDWRGQLMLVENGEVHVSSPIKFRIENDLYNNKPLEITEVFSWVNLKRYADSLVEELKQAVLSVGGIEDTFNTNELERQTTFETNENERDSTFNTNEDIRQTQELEREKSEATRQSVFVENEASRNETFDANESARQENEVARIEAEKQRVEGYQEIRDFIDNFEIGTENIKDGAITDSKIENVDYTKVKVDRDASLKDVNDKILDTIYPYYLKSTSVSERLTDDSLIKVGEYRNNSDVDIKSLEINGKKLLALKPGEYVKHEIYYNLYDKVTFKSLVKNFSWVGTDSIRVMFTIPNNDFVSSISRHSVFAPNTKFLPEKQINFSTNSGNFIGLHSNLSVHINFTKSEITGAGFPFDDKGVTNYISTLSDFDIFIRRKNYKELKGNFKLQIPKGDLTISKSQDMSLSVDIFQKSKALLGTNFKKYFASVKNTLDFPSENRVVKLYVSFDFGECKDESNIIVKGAGDVVLAHQWRDDYNVNYKFDENFGRYSDGSLKDGYLYFIDSFEAFEDKMYEIYVYQYNVSSYLQSVSVEEIDDGYNISSDKLSFEVLSSNKYLIDSITQNNVDSTFTQDPAFKDSINTTVTLRSDTNTVVKNVEIEGNGVVFASVKVTLTNELFDFYITTDVFANGEIKVSSTYKMNRHIESNEIFALLGRLSIKTNTDVATIGNLTAVEWMSSNDNLKKSARVLYAHGDWPRDPSNPPKPRYREFAKVISGTNDEKRLIAGWAYHTTVDAYFDIPKDEVFTSAILVNLGGYDTHENERSRAYNQLVGRISSNTKIKDKSEILSKAAEIIKNVQLDPYGDYGQHYHTHMGEIAGWKIFGDKKIEEIYDDFKTFITNAYGGNDFDSINNAYRNKKFTTNISSRTLLPPALYMYEEFKAMGDSEKATYCETLLKSYADTFALVVSELGFVPLSYSETSTGAPGNAVASALRGIATGIYLDPDNSTLLDAYNTLQNYFKKYILVKNVISDNDTANVSIYQYLHYSSYGAFEYSKAVEYSGVPSLINMTNYLFNASSSYGAMREQEYCVSSSRRGLAPTSAYVSYLLASENTPSSVSQANKILDRMLDHALPNGAHEHPFERWRADLVNPYSNSASFETQILGELVYLMLAQNVKTLN